MKIFFYGILLLLFACKNKSTSHQRNQKNELSDIQSENATVTEDTLRFVNFNELAKHYEKEIDTIDRLIVNAYKSKNVDPTLSIDSIQFLEKKSREVYQKRNSSIYNYILTRQKTSTSLKALLYLSVDVEFPIRYVDSLFNDLPDSLRISEMGKLVEKKINEKLVPAGQQYFNPSLLNMKLETNNGQVISLMEIECSYIVLDFWASWCLPCRYENREIVKKMKMIKRKDISIIGVSLDKNAVRWKKACREDGLNYISICDFKELQSPIVTEFIIKKIPQNVIITKNGSILGRNIWGDKLIDFLNRLPM